jgi:putative tricarboxylic transport membrane protein
MGKFGYPVVPMLMGVILGPLAEKNFMRALMISDGSYSTFFRNYICWIIWLFIFVSLFWPKIHSFFRNTEKTAPVLPGQNETQDDDDDD